jgi:hypothetical protein
MLKRVKLAMKADRPVGQANRVGIEEATINPPFEEANADEHFVFAREVTHRRDGPPLHWLRKGLKAGSIKISHMPISGDAHLRKCENLGATDLCALGHVRDYREVVNLVAGAVLKLGCGCSNATHLETSVTPR